MRAVYDVNGNWSTQFAQQRTVVLTGDRPTGPLHLGHYVGSLKNRVALQETHEQYVLLADAQALTDNGDNPGKIAAHVFEVACDYIACGIDPEKTTICVQSCLPALPELTSLYLNLVTVSRLERNPTIKEEIRSRGFERDIPAGFLCYPIAQAADITAFHASVVPVGDDQLPMIEQTNEIVRRINRLLGKDLLVECKAMLSQVGRLPGIDGAGKMSKSARNALNLSSTAEEVTAAIRLMYTDPNHLRASDPGLVEGNVVFAYLDAFDPEPDVVEQLKCRYRAGGLGDSAVKKRLEAVLQDFLTPIRNRRAQVNSDPGYVHEVLKRGTEAARSVTSGTLVRIKRAMGLPFF